MGILSWLFDEGDERRAMGAVRRFQRDSLQHGMETGEMLAEGRLRVALAGMRRDLSLAVADEPGRYEELLATHARRHGEAIYHTDKPLAKKWATWIRTLGPSDLMMPEALEIWRRHCSKDTALPGVDLGITWEAFR